LVPSPKVATYDLKPEMSAFELTDQLLGYLTKHQPDFICMNYANTDMVGHTGDFQAAIKAATAVDECLSNVVPMLLSKGYDILIIADHGNSDIMINPDGSPHTAHTTNPVPLIFISENDGQKDISLSDGKLGDLAPTILHLLGITIPDQMTGDILVNVK